jgi:hypothetical protein
MKGNEEYWGGGISTISQNFLKSPSILFHRLESSISPPSPNENKGVIVRRDQMMQRAIPDDMVQVVLDWFPSSHDLLLSTHSLYLHRLIRRNDAKVGWQS